MATYFDITLLPKKSIAGFPHRFRVTARNADGTTDAAFTGTVTFTATEPAAALPAPYTFIGGDNGVRDFFARFNTVGSWTLTATSALVVGNGRTFTTVRPPGWGIDDEGILPYGDAAASIGIALVKARARSTREVDVTVSNLAQDNSPFSPGDALNPSTWSVQRLDSSAFLSVVNVEQVGTYTYRLLCLEEFGPVSVVHRVNSTTLKDLSGNLIQTPKNADFLGLLEDTKIDFSSRLAKQKVRSRDIANSQVPGFSVFAGTLQIGGDGDYKTVTGTELTRKLVIRRLITRPGDFFHLPNYGIGLRMKEPLPTSDLPKLKKAIEQQCLQEQEVQAAKATLTLDPANNTLIVRVQVQEKQSGQQIDIGFKVNDTGVVL